MDFSETRISMESDMTVADFAWLGEMGSATRENALQGMQLETEQAERHCH
jgi:hypothetical protein